jgi:ABC-2 type transport system ATP-binding protein
MAVVEANELRRSYGSFEAVKGVSFRIERGRIVGLLGPNGAGKSTIMKMLTTWLAPSSGSATVCGHDALTAPLEVKKNLGYLPENAPIDDGMSVRSYLEFIASVRGLGAAERERAIAKASEEVGLTDKMKQTVGTLSKGYRQRVGLAQAILHQPPLLILDEPTNGLDPNQIVEIRSLIRRLGETRTVVLSTHILSEVQVTCDDVLILHQGRLVADGPTAQVIAASSGLALTVGLAPGKVKVASDRMVESILRIPGITRVDPAAPGEDAAVRFLIRADRDVREDLFHWAVSEGQALVELSAEKTNLEEVFRRLTEAR